MSQQDEVKKWQRRVDAAERRYQIWSKRFKTDTLEDFYRGWQWPDDQEPGYTINLFYSTIETHKPVLYFFTPTYKVTPKPTREDDPMSLVEERAALREQILNYFARDEKTGLFRATQLALHEAHFRFGVVEVGYSADFVENPNLGKPVLKESKPMVGEDGRPVIDTREYIPQNERVYVRRIPAKQFRVSIREDNDLERCDWCGYYEYVYLEDLKRSKIYKNTRGLETGMRARLRDDEASPLKDREEGFDEDVVKLWKIWDIRTKTRYVFVEGYDKFLLVRPFKHLPFAVLAFHDDLDSFYPIPPTFNWLSPQIEINETREMQRIHRARAVRRYTYVRGAIQEDYINQLVSGGDMTIVPAEAENPIQPVPDAPLDSAIWRNVPQTRDDFIEVSGVTSEQRGLSQAETATQAQILDSRARIREEFARSRLARWLCKIGKLVLRVIEENFTEDFAIRLTTDSLSPFAPMEAEQTAFVWKTIRLAELGEFEYEVDVELDELSPSNDSIRREAWNQVLALLSNPGILAILASSEAILRRTLKLYGITNERYVIEIKRVAGQLAQMFLGQPQPQAQLPSAGQQLPSQQDIADQLNKQIGLEV